MFNSIPFPTICCATDECKDGFMADEIINDFITWTGIKNNQNQSFKFRIDGVFGL